MISPAWAVDAKGIDVATNYEVRGNDLIQIVDHKIAEIAYPVVTDPYLGFTLISTAKWKNSNNLAINPTVSGRLFTSTTARNAGWAEVKSKVNINQNHYNPTGLKNQYDCHVLCGLFEGEWNLEPLRPSVSLAATLAAFCNPSGNPIMVRVVCNG